MPNAARLSDLVTTSQAVRQTNGRIEKRQLLRALFQQLQPTDLRLAASYLAGELPQGRLSVGWRALSRATTETRDAVPSLFDDLNSSPTHRSPTLGELDAAFDDLRKKAGAGSARQRDAMLRTLFSSLSKDEAVFLRGLILGELRQGALRAMVLEAVAETFDIELDALRRAVMFAGTLGEVTHAVAEQGPHACARFGPRPLTPIEPMLAAQATTLEDALTHLGTRAAAEWKLDGVRVQAHRLDDTVRVYTRRLRDVTPLAPEVVSLVEALGVTRVILDGEVIGLDADGKPVAFQDLMSRFARQEREADRAESMDLFGDVDGNDRAMQAQPAPDDHAPQRLVAAFFDVLDVDGESFVDRAYRERRAALEALLSREHLVPQRVVDTVEDAQRMYDEALAAGHEGVVLKSLDAPYTGGRRGAAWQKVKPAVTLDLVILAAEWGSGRREGFLSNLHLGARDPGDPQRFFMLGKTFKGLTDDMLRSMTRDLLALETAREGHIVIVQPLRVVEIAFDAVQRSRRYESGYALRFARVKRFRPDKEAREANTLAEVQRIYEARR